MIRLLVLLVLATPLIARADNPSLAEARKAIEEIRYDDARELLVQALKQGANRPEELVEIYKLSGATAAVLGPEELAEQYYRRMLALAPDATLPPGASPRLRDPFVAAQAYMAAQQRFDARATRTERGIAVSIVDPLGMVVAAGMLERGELRGQTPVVAGQPVVLEDAGSEVVLLDEHGNFLRLIAVPAREVVVETPDVPHTPVLERWITWAIPAGVFAGASIYLFIDAQRSRGRLDDILANPSMHYFDEAEAERRHWRNATIAAWVGAGLAVGFATTAFVMAQREPSVTIAPAVGPDQAGVQLHAKF